MEIYRNNVKGAATTGDDCFRSMQRHTTAKNPAATAKPVQTAQIAAPAIAAPIAGDIIYGAKAIAGFIFGDTGKRARRRVYNLWDHYEARKERGTGFFKLGGALCLSKHKWLAFHDLG